jgi:hypothetical protein
MENLTPIGIGSADRAAHSESLYPMTYRGIHGVDRETFTFFTDYMTGFD